MRWLTGRRDEQTPEPGTANQPASILDVAWRQQSVWSEAANRAKRSIVRNRQLTLLLIVVAAAAGTAAARFGSAGTTMAKILAAVAIGALVLSPFVSRNADIGRIQAWTRLRSASEDLKAEIHQYLAGVSPYRGEDREDVFHARFAAIAGMVQDLAIVTDTVERQHRGMPPVRDVPSYVEHRLLEQLNGYYRPSARRMARNSSRIRRAVVILSAAAAVFNAVILVVGSFGLADWIGVLTTMSASLAAYGEAQRYDYQQLEYARSAAGLERLHVSYRANFTPAQEDTFVLACEEVISVSNEGWMSKMSEVTAIG